MKHLAPLIAGLLFGAGLVISGMVNPMKVVNFLDLSGNWDPTLIFVMAADCWSPSSATASCSLGRSRSSHRISCFRRRAASMAG